MTTTWDASHLTLDDVYRILKFEEHFNSQISSLLSLETLTEFERQEVLKIRAVFLSYYRAGTLSEGQVKFILLAPLMWLAGFYHPSIKITMEEGIAAINVDDEDKIIKGRMDILAVTKIQGETITTPFQFFVVI
jgi:hypothetical protein